MPIKKPQTVSLFVTIPHAGEKVPSQTPWLNALPEEILMCDVDRYVDFLYEPALHKLSIPFTKTEWHRYAADMNRIPTDVDAASVIGSAIPAGSFNRGFHWVITTYKNQLMTAPMSPEKHQELIDLIYKPFHASIRNLYEKMHEIGRTITYHIDAHSMPSLGTSEHRDPGEKRADIVVSDCKGTSCSAAFKDLVIAAYVTAGFKVGYNWPYLGGRVTEQYGDPARGQHVVQVELNRELYMDEKTKKLKPEPAKKVQDKILFAIDYIKNGIPRDL